MQASLSTVVTNDPAVPAWLFLTARGPRAFHVLGRICTDDVRKPKAVDKQEDSQRAAASGGEEALETSDWAHDDDWPTVVAQSTGTSSGPPRRAGDGGSEADLAEPSETIEVLLPEGDDVLEYPLSDAPSDESDDFVAWMAARTAGGKTGAGTAGATAAPKKKPGSASAKSSPPATAYGLGDKHAGKASAVKTASGGAAGGGTPAATAEVQRGGSRTQRRRAAQKRARGIEADGAAGDGDGGAAHDVVQPAKKRK